MENYIIYEDDEVKITIDSAAHDYIENYYLPTLKISKPVFLSLFSLITEELENRNIKIEVKKNSFLFWNEAPILNNNSFIYLSEPFKIFEMGLAILSSNIEIRKNKNKIESEIESYYEDILREGKAFCKIFPRPLYEIDGYLAYFNGEKLVIMFFKHNIQELDEDYDNPLFER